LLINSIYLKIYNTGIALWVMECENHGVDKDGKPQDTIADVKNINDYGRRITLPFIPAYSDFSACADLLEVYVPELAKSFRTDFRAFIEEINKSGNKKDSLNLNHLSSYIKGILSHNCEYQFSSKITDDKETVYIHPAMDDRMFVASIVIDKNQTEKILGDPNKSDKYPYLENIEEQKSLYEFVFLDPDEGCSCQNKEMRKELLDKHLYKRWFDYGSVYGICAQSMVLLFNGGAMHLVNTFLTIYVRMACLCLAQRASLMHFQKETADISRLIHEKENKIRIATITKLMDLQERFSAFESQICFDEITPQEQGIEMYSMFKDSFLIDKELENVKSQITGLHDSADTYLDYNFNRVALIFTIIGGALGLIELIGIKIFESIYDAMVLGAVASLLTVFIILLSFRRKRRK